MKISTKYLLRTMLRWAWLALLAGAILAGGFYALKGGRTPAPELSGTDAVEPDAPAPELDVSLDRFSLYQPDLSGWRDAETQAVGVNEYAASVAAFAAARFQTDASYWRCYDAVLRHYPDLDDRVFTSDVMRGMITVWQYNYDVVLKVTPPAIPADQLSGYAAAMGLNPENADPSALTAQVCCTLRDAVWQAMQQWMDDPAALADAGIVLRRAPSAFEEMMAEQSTLKPDEASFAVKQGVLNGGAEGAGDGAPHIGKKTLALLFLIGFALVEAVVALIALFDPRVKDETDLAANTDLPILQTVPDASAALTETALCLSGSAPVLLGVGVEPDALSALAEKLDAALKQIGRPAEEKTHAVAAASDAEWLAALEGKPVVLAVQTLGTTYDALRAASRHLAHVRADVRGAVLLEKRKHTKG